MTTRRTFLQLGAAVGAGALIRWQLDPTSGLLFNTVRAFASVGTPQTALDGGKIPKFVDPLPTFAGRRIGDPSIEVGMFEFQQNVLPEDLYAGRPAPFNAGTYVWGYQVGDAAPSWPGATIEAQRGRTTTVKYVNALPLDPFLRKYLTFDQTIHWADPLHQMGSFDPFTGPIPTVVHLHGAEDSSLFDGAPEAWFTPDGRHGKGYSTLIATDPNAAVYEYPNGQQAATLWFHDHALGITRLNVFSGLAAFYFIRDQYDTGRSDNPLRLPAGPQEIELMIQDRQFDTNGQLLFPDSPANPSLVDGAPGNPGLHPFWIPEFFGDVICVNGRSWPYLNVEPRRYRFHIVNSSNSRFYRMGLADSKNGAQGPPLWQIGTDGGLLDRPVQLPGLVEPFATHPTPTTRLFLAPSERADIILDFTGAPGDILKRGIRTLEDVDEISILAVPDILIQPAPPVAYVPPIVEPPDPCALCPAPPAPAPPPPPPLQETVPTFSKSITFSRRRLTIASACITASRCSIRHCSPPPGSRASCRRFNHGGSVSTRLMPHCTFRGRWSMTRFSSEEVRCAPFHPAGTSWARTRRPI